MLVLIIIFIFGNLKGCLIKYYNFYYNWYRERLEFRESCLKQDKITFNRGRIANIYIVYELDMIYVKTNPTLVNCLFGAVSLTKMLTLISTNILDTELEVIFIQLVMDLVEM